MERVQDAVKPELADEQGGREAWLPQAQPRVAAVAGQEPQREAGLRREQVSPGELARQARPQPAWQPLELTESVGAQEHAALEQSMGAARAWLLQ